MLLPPSVRRDPDDPRNGPVLRRQDLLDSGVHDRAIGRLMKAGDLVRVRHGAYVEGRVHAELDQSGVYGLRTRAVILQSNADVVASHVSAIPEYGGSLWGFELASTHVTRKDGKAGRREAGVEQHRGKLEDGDVVTLNGIEVTCAARAAVEVTMVAPVEPSLCFVCHVLHEGLATPDDLARQVERTVNWPGSLSTDLVVRLADGAVESLAEARCINLFFRQGLPRPKLQHEIRDESGEVVARVDFAWPELGVYVEFDGMIKYQRLLREGESASDVVVREKRREERIYELTGLRCVRLTWSDLGFPAQVAARVRAAMEAFASAA